MTFQRPKLKDGHGVVKLRDETEMSQTDLYLFIFKTYLAPGPAHILPSPSMASSES